MIDKIQRHLKKGTLFRSIIKYIFSVNSEVSFGGVAVYLRHPIFSTKPDDRPHFQGGEIKSHNMLTKKGDTVIVIGGGMGVSAIVAAQKVGETGRVIIYESNKSAVKNIKNNVELNNVSSVCEVIHGIVGLVTDDHYTLGEKVDLIPVADLQDCDVLEMDCEGAEIEILRHLTIRPRVIIVEIDKIRGESSLEPEWVLNDLKNKGYRIVLQCTSGGFEIDDQTLKEYLYKNRNDDDMIPDPFGEESWPVVVAAVKD